MTVTEPNPLTTASRRWQRPTAPEIFGVGDRSSVRIAVTLASHVFDGFVYAARPTDAPPRALTEALLAEGYREQAEEALWMAERSIAAQREALPDDK
jgi:hypothetical protein